MKTNRPSKCKVVLIALLFSSAILFGGVRKAHAFVDPITIYAAAVVGALVIAGTIATIKATVCAPVAAYRASDHANGFTGAFGDCFRSQPSQSSPVDAAGERPRPIEEPENPDLQD